MAVTDIQVSIDHTTVDGVDIHTMDMDMVMDTDTHIIVHTVNRIIVFFVQIWISDLYQMFQNFTGGYYGIY